MSKYMPVWLLPILCMPIVVVAQTTQGPAPNGQLGAGNAAGKIQAAKTSRLQAQDRARQLTEINMAGRNGRPVIESAARSRNNLNLIDRSGNNPAERISSRQNSSERTHLSQVIERIPMPGTRIDHELSHRLAAIDRIRDRALETGNLELLSRADSMEMEARTGSGKHRGNGSASSQMLAAKALRPESHGHSDWKTNETNRPYGQLISEQARELGDEFGRITSEHARLSGSEFGEMNSIKTRFEIYQSVVEPISDPSNDVNRSGDTEVVSGTR